MPQTARDCRWITIRTPFDYRWPDRSAITAFSQPGEFLVKNGIADFAVGKGFATEGKADGSETRSVKGKRTRAAKTATVAVDAETAKHGPDAGVDGAHLADDDRADVQLSVDSDAEQR